MNDQKPKAVFWFQVYCGCMAALYLLLFVSGIALVAFSGAMDVKPEERTQMVVVGVVYAVMGLPLAVVFLLPLFVGNRPWVWIYDLVLICLGMTSICCLPITIPLLIYWLKPEVKTYFGREA